jgi:DNA-binding HxlR family transcriptional regulator
MRRISFADMTCSLARALEVVGEWWTLLVLRDLFVGLTRFEDICADLGVATNVLTDRLATLVDHGLVERRRYQDHPERFDYVLTEKGRDLFPAIAALVRWGDRWESGEAGAPMTLVHRDCGEATEALVVCSKCGRPLDAGNVVAVAGPGGRTGRGTSVIAPLLHERGLALPARPAAGRRKRRAQEAEG